MTYYALTGLAMLVSWLVSKTLQRRFQQYSQLPIGISGREIAERMLRENDINDVQVVATGGSLTDHYNPASKTVNLSDVVYAQNNVAAAAVAAHECGHAIQHAKGYAPLKLRSTLVPVTNVSTKLSQWVLMAGMVLAAMGSSPIIFLIGIVLFGMSTLFSFITLPVEFNASSQALGWLRGSGYMPAEYQDEAQNALKWAAMTYVVAALASLGQLLYFVMRFMQMQRR